MRASAVGMYFVPFLKMSFSAAMMQKVIMNILNNRYTTKPAIIVVASLSDAPNIDVFCFFFSLAK